MGSQLGYLRTYRGQRGVGVRATEQRCCTCDKGAERWVEYPDETAPLFLLALPRPVVVTVRVLHMRRSERVEVQRSAFSDGSHCLVAHLGCPVSESLPLTRRIRRC